MDSKFMHNLPSPVWEEPDETGGGATPPTQTDPSMLEGTPPVEDTPPTESEEASTKLKEPDAPEPVTFEALTLPEGFDVESESATNFLDVINSPDMSVAERAQKLVDLQTSVQEETAKRINEELQSFWDNQRTANRQAVQALPEIGGDKLDESLAQIKKGLEAAGATDETFKAFTETGAGDHPEIIRVLYALTKPHKEGQPIFGSPPQGPLSQADRMFGSK